ncbi:MAG: hypothetical protein BWK78_10050 [Thiotrichaceae bacterium IS1]|nr:MAG: hypothetical protein BWK78_10050 [Thiotrichaceae bacterium IS1]
MNQHYRRHGILFISLFLLTVLSQWVQAKLVIEPARPIIAIGQQIQLRVLGEKGEVTWQSGGTFLGKGNQITYVAPNEVGQYYVSASTDKESAKAIITVLTAEKAAQAFAPEKSVWEVFANRNTIEALSLSEDKKILWVGTTGGLEKRDAITGELLQKFTNLNGLPDIQVSANRKDYG